QDERNQVLTSYLWVRQAWLDAHLTWDKDAYDGIDSIRIPSSYVWRPDIILYNNADDRFGGSMETNVVLRSDGHIVWDSPAITRSSCKVDVSYFPFDGQRCHLTFGSWTYNGNQIDLHNRLDAGDLTDFVENVEWEVLGMPATRNVVTYGCCSEPYPDITYTLLLRRRASFYIFNLLLPCVMVSFLAPLGFYLPADSGEKVSLGVTVLLALTVFQLLVAESMPPSESVPLIGKYYIATMTMITASTALTIFIMNVHHCGPGARPVPPWARRLILHHMARLCCVYEVGESCKSPQRAPGRRVGRGDAGAPGESPGEGEVGAEAGGCPRDHCLCHHDGLLRNVIYIAGCFRRHRAAQRWTGEWKKVAKVMDRFLMWVFFLMVFLMSVLVLAKAA
ncbi:Neuronal acetylcholine receptor subunit alpha-10, partial [Eudyptes moseleyi]